MSVGTEREYEGNCPRGHRTYLRLRDLSGPFEVARCPTCGATARLTLLPPVPGGQ